MLLNVFKITLSVAAVIMPIAEAKALKAEAPAFHFTYLSSKEGLSSNNVYAILKDKYGFLWFGTDDGLNKFDGLNFTVYRKAAGDKYSLQANEITSLHEDKEGRLWIGTNGGGVSLYDRNNNRFITIPAGSLTHGISNKKVSSICSDDQGKVWIGTYEGVLNLFDPAKKHVTRFIIKDAEILKIFKDSGGNIWTGTSTGLYVYNAKSKRFRRYIHQPDNSNSLSAGRVREITEDNYGNIWIGTSEGLNMLKPGQKRFRRYLHSADNPQSICSNYIYSLTADKKGNVWVGTDNGISIINSRSSEIINLRPDKRSNQALSGKSIRSIFIDDQNIYWIGTYQAGISKYDENLTYFHLQASNSFDRSGLSAPVVTSFAESTEGNIFAGTDGGGLNLYDKKTGLFRHINFPLSDGTPSSELKILSMKKSREGLLWIGTYNHGLIIYNPRNGAVKEIKKGNSAYQLRNNDVFSIYEDHEGKIWIGTNGGGIQIYDPENGKIKTLEGLSNLYIRDIVEDERKNIWIATYGGGIYAWNRKTRKFSQYSTAENNLGGDVVLSLLADSRGNLWAGTLGAGLSCLPKGKSRFITYTEKDGMANDVIYKIIEDKQGNLWLSTNKGISRMSTDRKFKNFSSHHGLQQNAFVRGSGLLTSWGDIYFGGLEGFNYFNPSNLKQNRNIPEVVITSLFVSNKLTFSSIAAATDKSNPSSLKEVHINYKEPFTLNFAALNYTLPQQNQFMYKLEGLSPDWIYNGTKSSASFTYLEPGEYTFIVKASNNDGLWNNKGASLKIIVDPPFWMTSYAYVSYILLLAGSILLLRARGIRRLKKEFLAEQDRKEKERQRELDQLKLKFLTNLSHEFRTPISLILAPTDKLLCQHQDKESNLQLMMIKRNARRLLNLVNQLLDFRRMEEQELKLHTQEGEIIAFIKDVADSFLDLAQKKDIDFNFYSEVPALFTRFDADKIERILFNLLSNAFKFTYEQGRVELHISEDSQNSKNGQSWLLIKISDTGIGISRERHEKIFKRFFQSDSSGPLLNQGSGIGLSITKEFVKMHNGSIHVKSELGQGSVFIVKLPFIRLNAAGQSGEKAALTASINPEPVKKRNSKDSPVLADSIPLILLIEDNRDFRFYLKDNLKNHYRIAEAEDGSEGWQKALALHPNLIVSDISMPEMDGIALCRKLKSDKRTNHIPVILLTAAAGEDEQLRGLQTGANDYLTKPFNFEILHSKIDNLLALKETLKNTYTRQIKIESSEPVIETEDSRLLNAIISYIEDNLTDANLSVEQMGRHLGVSRTTLYKRMLDITGETPVEFIRSYKLDKAKNLLEKSDFTVSQICYMTGFSAPNYFTKSFKAKYNLLPSEYIQLKRNVQAGPAPQFSETE